MGKTDAEARWARAILTCLALSSVSVLLWFCRARWNSALRFLSILGYVYVLLAVVRIGMRPTVPCDKPASTGTLASVCIDYARGDGFGTPRKPATRRVVWIIFDELDYDESLGAEHAWRDRSLPNLVHLQAAAVSAKQAYSPAKDTEESLPALLVGSPINGSRVDARGLLLLNIPGGNELQFKQDATLFARLPGGPASGALLGYYHPYCAILPMVRACEAFYLGNAGRWFDGLLFFSNAVVGLARWVPGVPERIPASLLDLFDPMYRISQRTIAALPGYLARDDKSLVFIHLNVPHYPAAFAQRALNLRPQADDRAAYSQNLLFVDQLVGQIEDSLVKSHVAGFRQETLLVLTSDHWHRIDSQRRARPVPFIAWHVGESDGASIDQPISTVNTAALVLDFLDGTVTTHADIARWWQDKPVFPTWIPDNYKF